MEEDAYRKGWYVSKNGDWDEKDAVTGWRKDSTGWRYILANGSYLKDTWKKIDGKWYYFHKNGYAASKEYVDGWWLSENCAWNYKPRARWYKNSKGWWYEDTAGWYAAGKTYVIDGVKQSFDDIGYWKEN